PTRRVGALMEERGGAAATQRRSVAGARTPGRLPAGGQHAALIYDIGAHSGDDTDFYLGKGFRVVAVEANPALADRLRARFPDHLREERLIVLDRVIGVDLPPEVNFYVNHAKDDWSALDREVASKGVHQVSEVRVGTTTLRELFARHGVPYYLKVDIEGGDLGVAEALLAQPHRPEYVSFEWHEDALASVLDAAGYRSFQLVNQFVKGISQHRVKPAREGGNYWPGPPTGTSSGLFGRELGESDWVDLQGILDQRLAYQPLLKTPDLRGSWFDLHARLF
ncbi:MAG: FkbM family methyltransferase, partial [Sporichthyaceae bacterium]